jgi:DUF4097 and DUF4098 domain-containing protein YvlB
MKSACLLLFTAVLGLAPAASTGAFAAPAVPWGGEQKETEQVDRTYPLEPGGTLRIKNFSGTIHITGSQRNDVVIHAVRRATRERLNDIRLDIQTSKSEIVIEANKRSSSGREREENVVETTFEIEVPQQTHLDVHAFASDLHIEHVSGPQKLYAFSGTIQVDEASGSIDAETFSGEIKADLQRETAAPVLSLKTFSGDIDVRLAASAQGRVDFSSFSGSLDSSLPMRYTSGKKRSVRGELGSGGATNDLEFHTFSGDVRIRD